MKDNKMATMPILPMLIKMSLPPMFSMFIASMYNIIDSMYVSSLGEYALSAVSLVFPVQNLILAFAVGIGVAINALIARNLGAKDLTKASIVASNGFLITLAFSILFGIIGLTCMPWFFGLFVEDVLILDNAIIYGQIVCTLTFGQMYHLYYEKIFQAKGDMLTPMLMQLLGAFLNIILDPIFIFGIGGYLKFGVAGAAIATVIGQISSFLLGWYIFKKKEKQIKLSFKEHLDFNVMKQIIGITIPVALMMALPSIVVSLLNSILVSISATALAFFGIYYKVSSFVLMPANGIIQGMRPLIGFNHGAMLQQRVGQIIRYSILCVGLILSFGGLLMIVTPQFLLGLFNAGEEMLNIGIPGLRILGIATIISTFGIVYTGVFESLGKGNYSLIVSLLRQFIILLPAIFILLPHIGIHAIWISYILSESFGGLCSYLFYKRIQMH